jgi:o-succinylbenzoate synthase
VEITDLEAIPYALRFREPYVTANGTLDRREMVLVRLHTDEGLVGLGEAVPLSLRGGERLEKVWRQLRRASHRLSGTDVTALGGDDPLAAAIGVVVAQLPGRRYAPPVKAALEMALFDLAGKASGRPLWELMRADSAMPVRCNATLAAGPPAEVAKRASAWAERGFRTFKLKLGTGDDLEQVAAVRGELGDEARIRVDANGSWSVADATAILGELEALDVELAEQPSSSLRELSRVAAATRIPIAADESVNDAKDAERAVREEACRYATVKLAKVGGMGPAVAIAAQLPAYLSSALDGPVGIAAAGHLAQAIYIERQNPGLDHGLATQDLFADDLPGAGCEIRDGELHLPEGSGLGVRIDENSLEKLAL